MADLYARTQAAEWYGWDIWSFPPDGRRFVMVHVRVASPVAVTGQIAGTLAAAAGVQNVVVQAGGPPAGR